jgi:cytochrome oxidase Cu insertion factor (SCO1/SenC/PrrC family)
MRSVYAGLLTVVIGIVLAGAAGAQGEKPQTPKPKRDPGKVSAGPPEGARMPVEGTLKVGDPVPDITVQDLDGKRSVRLTELKGRPTVLFFGSCT